MSLGFYFSKGLTTENNVTSYKNNNIEVSMKPTQAILAEILKKFAFNWSGRSLIIFPALARVSNQKLAITVYTNEGEVIQAGGAGSLLCTIYL